MKILDDIVVCKQRAKLRAEAVLQTGLTPHEAHGKTAWARLRNSLMNLVEMGIKKAKGEVLTAYLEKDVALTATFNYEAKKMWNILLRGRVDSATLARLRDTIFAVLVEVTEYRNAPVVVKNRLQAYASALYGELGFPVVPVLIILGEQGTVENLEVLISRSPIPGTELKRSVGILISTLAEEKTIKAPSSDLCVVCDPSIRRLCPYHH